MNKAFIRSQVDRFAYLRQEIKKLKDEEDQIKNDLSSLGEKVIEGNEYIIIIKDMERKSLDLERIEDEMGTLWYEQHLVTTYFQRYDIESKENKI